MERINYLEVIGKIGALCGRESLNPFLTSFIKVSSIWIKDIMWQKKIIKSIEENVGEYPSNLKVKKDFFRDDCKSTNHKERKKKVDLTISD